MRVILAFKEATRNGESDLRGSKDRDCCMLASGAGWSHGGYPFWLHVQIGLRFLVGSAVLQGMLMLAR